MYFSSGGHLSTEYLYLGVARPVLVHVDQPGDTQMSGAVAAKNDSDEQFARRLQQQEEMDFYGSNPLHDQPIGGTSSGQMGQMPPQQQQLMGGMPPQQQEMDLEAPKHKLTPNYVIFRMRKMLARGRSYGLPQTDGTFWSVFKAEVLQEHSIVSICGAHDLHPFSRNERISYMLNAITAVFFLAVITNTNGTGEAGQILITVTLIVLYKMFARYLLECNCIFTGGYNESMEIEDGDNDPLNNQHSYFNCVAQIAGYFTSFLLNLWSILLLIISIIVVVRDGDSDFVRGWLISQCASILFTEFFFMAFFTYVNMKCYDHEGAFRKKWHPYFHARGLPDPVSLTTVAELARKEYIEEHGADVFYTKFADFDRWFDLDKFRGARKSGIGPPSASGEYSLQVEAKHEDVRLAAELDPTRSLNQENPIVVAARPSAAPHAPSQHPYSMPYPARPPGMSTTSAVGAPHPYPMPPGQAQVIPAVRREGEH